MLYSGIFKTNPVSTLFSTDNETYSKFHQGFRTAIIGKMPILQKKAEYLQIICQIYPR